MALPPAALRPILERYASIDQLFAFIEAAAGRQPYALKVEYDATLGYPMFISLRQGGTSVDDDLEVRISGFRAVN